MTHQPDQHLSIGAARQTPMPAVSAATTAEAHPHQTYRPRKLLAFDLIKGLYDLASDRIGNRYAYNHCVVPKDRDGNISSHFDLNTMQIARCSTDLTYNQLTRYAIAEAERIEQRVSEMDPEDRFETLNRGRDRWACRVGSVSRIPAPFALSGQLPRQTLRQRPLQLLRKGRDVWCVAGVEEPQPKRRQPLPAPCDVRLPITSNRHHHPDHRNDYPVNTKGTRIMTTKTNTPKTTAATKAPDTPWEMSCAVLIALWQTEAKAEADCRSRFDGGKAKPFTNGIGEATALLEVVRETRKQLEYEMRRHARSCGLEMPKLDR